MITITVSGREKTGKTIVANLIAAALERCNVLHTLRNSEDKFMSGPEAGSLLAGQQIEIVELTERRDRTT